MRSCTVLVCFSGPVARVLLFNATGERDSAAMLKLLVVSISPSILRVPPSALAAALASPGASQQSRHLWSKRDRTTASGGHFLSACEVLNHRATRWWCWWCFRVQLLLYPPSEVLRSQVQPGTSGLWFISLVLLSNWYLECEVFR